MHNLFTSDYGSNNEFDDEDGDTDMPIQQRWRVMQLEAMPPTVRNIYTIHLRKKNDYVKENTDQSMSFTQVGNDLNEDALLLLQHDKMGNSEETIDYEKVITYAFKQ